MQIYLSGPITGLSDSSIQSWRQLAALRLGGLGEIIDPAAVYYDAAPAFEKKENSEQAVERLRHGIYVINRNKNLIRGSDVLFANFLGAGTKASIGSIGEIYWANAFGKPIVIVREEVGNIHDHAMLNAMASCISHSLEDGFAAVAEFSSVIRKRAGNG
ncbi:MAG: nucleoside 2-deoxyribosyltransferase [Xanthobacteraceae bacterium]